MTTTDLWQRELYLHRWEQPLRGMADHWLWKTFISTMTALLAVNVQWLILAVLLWFVDIITGIIAARRRGEAITSYRFRFSFSKLAEYTIFCGVFVMIGNSFAVMSWLPEAAFLMVILTETKSIMENLTKPESMVGEMYRLIANRVALQLGKDGGATLIKPSNSIVVEKAVVIETDPANPQEAPAEGTVVVAPASDTTTQP